MTSSGPTATAAISPWLRAWAFPSVGTASCCAPTAIPLPLAAARAGVGIAVAQVPVGERDPGLVRVLPDLEVAVLETWIVTHENLARVPRVRAVFDLLAESFRTMSPRR